MEWKKKKVFVGTCLDSGSNQRKKFVIDESAGTVIVEKPKTEFLVGIVPLEFRLCDGKINPRR